MILKGNRRGGAKDLALHLMKDENEHVELEELRGFCAQNLMGALNEVYAISRGTRCQKFLYSLSVNPPPTEVVGKDDILAAIEATEKTLKLDGQPRAIVFHEKDGRRHAHVVWSLINAQEMKAVRLRNDRTKLQPLTRQLFIKHGWEMPKGLLDKEQRDPRNYDLQDYWKAKKTRRDARDIKGAIQTAWAISDTRAAFAQALEDRGFKLARGDRAAIVAVDMFGQVHAVPRMLDLKVKEVRAKIGDERKEPESFVTVEDALSKTAALMLAKLGQFSTGRSDEQARKEEDFATRRAALVNRQRAERRLLKRRQNTRRAAECQARQERFRSGFKGLWDRLRGEHKRIRALNEQEAALGMQRDQTEREAMAQGQLAERNHLKIFRAQLKQEFARERGEISQDQAHYENLRHQFSRDGPTL